MAESEAAGRLVAELGGAAAALPVGQVVARAELVILAVPDGAVAGLCASLSWREGQAAVHACGALGLDVLDAAAQRGALCAVMHPLQSFTSQSRSDAFAGVAVGIEADSPALHARLDQLATRLGARPFSLRGVSRPAYHAAAVLASNYVVALHAAAARAFELAGLPKEHARTALAPLTRGTADNLARLPLHEALTGPVSRGDIQTVEQHLRALSEDAALAELYRSLARELLRLPLVLSDATQRELQALLRDDRGDV